MKLGQPLLENRTEGRYVFSEEYVALLEDNPDVLNATCFSEEGHFYLDRCINKQISDLCPHRIQGVRLSSHCVQRELQYGATIERRDIRSRVHWRYVISERWICRFPDAIWHLNEFSLASKITCPTSHKQCCTSLSSWRFRGYSTVEQKYFTIWERIFMIANLIGLTAFCGEYFKDMLFQENLHITPKLKTAIQPETEAMYTENPTKILNNFVFLQKKLRDFRGHHKENVLVNKHISQWCRKWCKNFIRLLSITKILYRF